MITLLLAATLGAPIEVTVDIPSVYFVSGEAKAIFLSALESSLASALGEEVSARQTEERSAFARTPIWLVEAAFLADAGPVTPVLQATRNGRATWPLSLYWRDEGAKPIDILKGQSIAYPGLNPRVRDALRYWVFLNEPSVQSALAALKSSRDSRGAVSSLAGGLIGGAVVPRLNYNALDPTLGRISQGVQLGELPMPVVVLNSKLLGSKVEELRARLASATLPPVNGVIDAWKPIEGESLREFISSLRSARSPVRREYVLRDLPSYKIDVSALLPPPPPEPTFHPSVFVSASEAPLPDPPFEALSAEAPRE